MKRMIIALFAVVSILATACGNKETAPTTATISEDAIVAEVSKALETVQAAEATGGEEQAVSDKLFEISNWLTGEVWNDGFCDISHYIGRGTNSVGGELDLDYTMHKLDNAMEKREEYNEFINNLGDDEMYKELKYIWSEKLYPEMNSLYDIVSEKKPEPEDATSTFDASKFSTYNTDYGSESKKIRDELKSESAQ